MKYVHGMLAIWQNLFIGRSRVSLLALAGLVLVAVLTALSVLQEVGWVGFTLVLLLWFVGFPSGIYVIDCQNRRRSK